jgi:DNA-binding NarL/FixJ family response regulator
MIQIAPLMRAFAPMTELAPIRVLVVDNHAMFAQAVAAALREHDDIEVVGVAGNATQGISAVAQHGPDVVLMDYRLPDLFGDEATRVIRRDHPRTAVVVVTAAEDEEVLGKAVDAGCSGFVMKQDGLDELVAAVRTAHAGGSVLPPRLLRSLMGRLRSGDEPSPGLTPRETEVLQLLAEGLDTRDVAERLSCSHNTARNHTQSIIRKLGAHSKLEAVMTAMRLGMLRPPATSPAAVDPPA